MSLIRMAVEGYRCFAERQDIELAPVTVVLGRNNSGKSALVRAALVAESGIRTATATPLDLDALVNRFGEAMLESFTDLVYGNRPHGDITIGLDLATGTGPVRVRAVIQHLDEFHTEVISSLELTPIDSVPGFRLDWELGYRPDRPGGATRYTLRTSEKTWTDIPIGFRGILPAILDEPGVPEEVRSRLIQLAEVIKSAFPAIRYLGPFRKQPDRRYRLPNQMPGEVGVGGEHVAGILARDRFIRQGRLIGQINDALGSHLPGWRLDALERGGMYAVVLTSSHDATISVNLADSGSGVAQVLPVFVQRAVDVLSPPPGPVLEIIEQPELHLHPAAHADLADLYLEAAKHSIVRFLIETHSETLLLRLRRRIAEGLVDPATVAIYFVEQSEAASWARRINIDDAGNLDYWPPGIFTEDYTETQALAAAQIDRSARAD